MKDFKKTVVNLNLENLKKKSFVKIVECLDASVTTGKRIALDGHSVHFGLGHN
jgi:hypothetical protein